MIRRAILAVGLACVPALATAGDVLDEEATPPGLRTLVFQHSRFESSQRDGDADRSPLLLQQLARGTLTVARFSDDSKLTLRLRGGRIGLYLAIRLGDRD